MKEMETKHRVVSDVREKVTAVAALDKKGCAKIRRKITGPFGDPRMDKTSVLQSFANPILGAFELARERMGRASCEPFCKGTCGTLDEPISE